MKKLKKIIGVIMLLIIPIFFVGHLILSFIKDWKETSIITIGAIVFCFFVIGWISVGFKLLED
jgi:hypothetical protein